MLIETKRSILKLIKEAEEQFAGTGKALLDIEDYVAEYLTANGVIAPPCKVGDVVYVLEDWGYKKELKTKEVGVIVIKGTNDFSMALWEDVYGGVIGTFADIGKTVFLSREEAEKALNGGGNG